MRLKIFLALTLLTSNAFATSYLCIGEAIGMTRETVAGELSNSAPDYKYAQKQKFILTKPIDKYEIHRHGENKAMFESCTQQDIAIICEGWANGNFRLRTDTNIFTSFYEISDESGSLWASAIKGRCSKL